jgi:hypothetical protein
MKSNEKALKFCRLALETLSPSALDAVRRDSLRAEIRVGIVVQHARAAGLLCQLAPDDATGEEHARNAAQNLVAVKALPGIDRRVLDSIDRAEFDLTRVSHRVAET